MQEMRNVVQTLGSIHIFLALENEECFVEKEIVETTQVAILSTFSWE